MITLARLKEVLSYDPESGEFHWKIRKYGVRTDGAALSVPRWYLRIQIDGRRYPAHRLAWFYHYGVWPKYQIDHRNRIENDNRIANLREATQQENCFNTKRRKTGFKGVSRRKEERYAARPWAAMITKDYKSVHLGYFETAEEAQVAYAQAAKRLQGEFMPDFLAEAVS